MNVFSPALHQCSFFLPPFVQLRHFVFRLTQKTIATSSNQPTVCTLARACARVCVCASLDVCVFLGVNMHLGGRIKEVQWYVCVQ